MIMKMKEKKAGSNRKSTEEIWEERR